MVRLGLGSPAGGGCLVRGGLCRLVAGWPVADFGTALGCRREALAFSLGSIDWGRGPVARMSDAKSGKKHGFVPPVSVVAAPQMFAVAHPGYAFANKKPPPASRARRSWFQRASDDQEVVVRHDRSGHHQRELDRSGGAVSVAVVGQGTGRGVVDDVVICFQRRVGDEPFCRERARGSAPKMAFSSTIVSVPSRLRSVMESTLAASGGYSNRKNLPGFPPRPIRLSLPRPPLMT